jgi:hypothetical protein
MAQPFRVTFIALACVACAASEKTPAVPHAPSPTAAAPAAPRVERRVVISLSRPSGSSVTTIDPDGTQHFVLDVLENGRGPHVEATVKLALDGTIAQLEAAGHHGMGTQFKSQFSREGERASWQSDEEHGEKAVQGSAFFVPLAELPELDGLLVQAALKHGGKLPVLPWGELHVEKNAEVTVSADGTARTLTGYSLQGLQLQADQTWMNPDGSWFGSVSEWFSVVPAGWESAIQPLLQKRRELLRAHDAQAFSHLAHTAPVAGLAFTHARVLDVERGRWLADHTVVVVKDRIAQVGPSAGIKPPAGVEVVDLQGRALIPGLWDMHSHLDDADGALDIASGVTTVRDVGNDPDKLDDYKARYDAGEAIGPHVLRFGFIEGRGDKAASSTITAETEDEAKKAVQFFADRHYDGVKIYNSMRTELVPLIAKEAHARGMRVTGHIPVHMLANEAVRAGYDGIEHANMLFLNFLATHETDTRDLTRFTLVGDKGADLDLASAAVRDFIELLAQRKTVVDPTLGVFEDMFVGQPGRVTPGLETLVQRLPMSAARGFLVSGTDYTGRRY